MARALICWLLLAAFLIAAPASAQNAMNWRETYYNSLPRYTLENDPTQNTASPLFAVDARYARPKVVMRSTIWSDPGDTVDLAALIADGAPGAATYRNAPYPGFYLYGWPLDTSGNYVASQSPYSATAYLGRNAQISMWLMETPTQTARGGAMVFGTTPLGRRTPFDRMWIRPNGWTVFTGAAFEGSGMAYPYNAEALPIQSHHSPMTGVNPYDYAGYGSVTVLAPDQSQGAGLALMSAGSPTVGVRWNFNNSNGHVSYVTQVGTSQRAVMTADIGEGSLHFNRAVYLKGASTWPTLNTHANNLPVDSGLSVLRVAANGLYNITGLQGGADGRLLYLLNVGVNNIQLPPGDVNSAAANRFGFNFVRTLQPGEGLQLYYSATTSRWHAM